MIVTMNNAAVKPVGTPPLQMPCCRYSMPATAPAASELLGATRRSWTIRDLRAVQMDDTGFASTMAPVAGWRAGENGLSPRAGRPPLEQWDFRHDVDNVGATVFNYWINNLLKEIFSDEMSESEFATYATLDQNWVTLQDLLETPDAAWWDDIATEKRETAGDIVTRSLKRACGTIAQDLGEDVSSWRWGSVHRVTYKHPFGYLPGLGRLLNIGPLESGGGKEVINNMAMTSLDDFGVIAGPSTRRLIDFARPEHSLTILPTGNSGHIHNPHYDDQAAMFTRGEYRAAIFTPEDIEAAREHEMHFLPQP